MRELSNHWRCLARERIAAIRAEQRAPRALEIGSALGVMLSILHAEGWQVDGREMWADWHQFATRYLQVPTSNELLVGRGKPHYDLIYNTQVFEHVNNFLPFLSAIHSRLLPGGMLYMSTTNANVASRPRKSKADPEVLDLSFAANPGTRLFIFDNPLHVNHWSQESIRAAMTSVGFTDVHTSTRGEQHWELVVFAMKRR